MKHNNNNAELALGRTDFSEKRAKEMDNIDEIIRFLRDDFPIRTVKEELEKEIELKMAIDKTTHDEIIKKLRNECGDVNVANWLSGKAKALTKDSALKIVFALQMSAKKASWFLMQSCWLDGLYMRDIKDVIYSYCLNGGMGYKRAIELIEKYASKDYAPNPDPAASDVFNLRLTEFLDKRVNQISSDDMFDDFISKYKSYFGSFHRHAYEKFMDLYSTIKNFDKVRTWERADHQADYVTKDEEVCKLIRLNIPSLKGQQEIIGDVLKKIAEDTLSRTALAEIKGKKELRQSKKITEVKRKHLLIMWLYVKAGTPDYGEYPDNQDAFAECINIINDDLLEPCGMPLLDPRNPFDWIIMNAIYYAYYSTVEDDDEKDDTVERICRVMEQLFQRGNEE